MRKLLSALLAVMAISSYGWAQDQSAPVIHVVQWFESLKDIAAIYEISEDALIEYNNLSSRNVRARQKLMIPGPEYKVLKDTLNCVEKVPVTVATKKIVTGPLSKVNIGLLLPFSGVPQAQMDHNLDFYCGALMAVKQLGEKGLDLVLDVKDFSVTPASVLCNNDFIVGPIRNEDIAIALNQIQDSTLLVSPLDAKASILLSKHTNLVQAAPHPNAQYERVVDWEISDSTVNFSTACNYIIVYNETDIASLKAAETALSERNIKYHVVKCGVQGPIATWASAYSPWLHNKVIIATTVEAVINNALRNIGIEESQNGNISVFCNNKIKSIEKNTPEILHKTDAFALCSYFIDYGNPETLSFIHSYRALFNAEPTQFAYQGYDIVRFMAETYAEYGEEWKEKIKNHKEVSMLQCSFMFDGKENEGLGNSGIRKVEYCKDYRIRLIEQ